ncbi:MAG: sigma-70 family RNA polymerase sigma factor [Polyangiaceae bacterium]
MKEALLPPLGLGASRTSADASTAEPRARLDFAAVFREHGAFVLRTVRRMGVPPRDVEDIAQNVFLVVHRHLASYEGRGSVKAWLFAIVRRAVADHRRACRRRPEIPTLDPPVSAVDPQNEADLDRARERALLDRALSALDDDKREVFILYELEQMAMADVAAAVGCPLQTAYSRLYAARERVKALVLAGLKGEGRGPSK